MILQDDPAVADYGVHAGTVCRIDPVGNKIVQWTHPFVGEVDEDGIRKLAFLDFSGLNSLICCSISSTLEFAVSATALSSL